MVEVNRRRLLVIVVAAAMAFAVGLVAGDAGALDWDKNPNVERGVADSNLNRVIDHEAGVVCYRQPLHDGGIDCLPIEQTKLAGQSEQ